MVSKLVLIKRYVYIHLYIHINISFAVLLHHHFPTLSFEGSLQLICMKNPGADMTSSLNCSVCKYPPPLLSLLFSARCCIIQHIQRVCLEYWWHPLFSDYVCPFNSSSSVLNACHMFYGADLSTWESIWVHLLYKQKFNKIFDMLSDV